MMMFTCVRWGIRCFSEQQQQQASLSAGEVARLEGRRIIQAGLSCTKAGYYICAFYLRLLVTGQFATSHGPSVPVWFELSNAVSILYSYSQPVCR